MILVGARRDARRLIRRLVELPWDGAPIVGFVDAGHPRSSSLRSRSRHLPLHPETDPVPILGSVDRLDELVDRARATHVVVAVSKEPGPRARPPVTHLNNSGVALHWVLVDSHPPNLRMLTEPSAHATGSSSSSPPLLASARGPLFSALKWARLGKRALDLSVASIALLALSPLLVAVALAILATTGRPVFYTQVRAGQGGRRFRMLKFRSMRPDAERETGPIWAADHDSRCTRVGAWLRHTNIDELPQLVNVVRGEMSLVGPRPERPEFVDQFCKSFLDYNLRHAVPGGMTGWAQVHGWRGRTSLRKRIQYDLDYIERWSLWLDVRILFMTVQHVLWGKITWSDSKRAANPES
jgi:exopolysaccharide biosynthesis polyprenyl glycosylphosphotransferase